MISSNAVPHTRQQKKAEKVREATQRWDVAFDRMVTGQREACQEEFASQQQGKAS